MAIEVEEKLLEEEEDEEVVFDIKVELEALLE